MASALPGDVCIGLKNVCILRMAKLDPDCSPKGGVDSGIVSAALVTMTASPEIEEGTVFEPKTGCGRIFYSVSDPDVIKRYNLTGEIITYDVELLELMFGGSLVKGKAAGPYAALNIGWAAPGTEAPRPNGVYLEVITQVVGQGAGDCASATTFTPYVGHIFGRVIAAPGDITFANDVITVPFTAKAFQNPAIFDGPWNDYTGTGYVPTSPYSSTGYNQAQFDAINVLAGCGYVTTPVAS